MADEPTGSLDPQTAEEIFDLLMEISFEDKHTLIMVTHDLSLAGQFQEALTVRVLSNPRDLSPAPVSDESFNNGMEIPTVSLVG